MSLKMEDLFRDMLEKSPSTSTISIIGRMRSGKTTFARLFSQFIKRYYENQGYSIYYTEFDPIELENLETVENMIREMSKDVNIIIMDDLSFRFTGNTKIARDLFNMISRIAHITLSDYNYIFFISHYSRSISPFLRASNILVLTSISHPEIASLKELFTLSSLYDYLYYVENNPDRHIYLIRYHVFERIVDFTIEKLRKPKTKTERLKDPFYPPVS